MSLMVFQALELRQMALSLAREDEAPNPAEEAEIHFLYQIFLSRDWCDCRLISSKLWVKTLGGEAI